jgi:hypothetical protein
MQQSRLLTGVIMAIILGVLSVGFFGCGGGAIKPGEANDVLATVKAEMESAGMECEYRDNSYDELTCSASDTYKTLIKYYSQSKRLRFMSLFGLAVACDDIYHEVMGYNWGYNVAQASCKDDTISFLSYILVPESGLNGGEVKDFLVWWGGAINDSLKDSGLWDSVK